MLKVVSLNLIPDTVPLREEFGVVSPCNRAQMTLLGLDIYEHGKIDQISQKRRC